MGQLITKEKRTNPVSERRNTSGTPEMPPVDPRHQFAAIELLEIICRQCSDNQTASRISELSRRLNAAAQGSLRTRRQAQFDARINRLEKQARRIQRLPKQSNWYFTQIAEHLGVYKRKMADNIRGEDWSTPLLIAIDHVLDEWEEHSALFDELTVHGPITANGQLPRINRD